MSKGKLQGATGASYKALLEVAIEAVVKTEENVFLSFYPDVKFEKGFPRGILVDKTDTKNTYKVKAIKLLDFLFLKGASKFNARMLICNKMKFEWYLARIEKGLVKSFEV